MVTAVPSIRKPVMKMMVESQAPRRGFFSIVLPKIAAHMPRKKIIRVNPMSVWNRVMLNVCIRFAENCDQQ